MSDDAKSYDASDITGCASSVGVAALSPDGGVSGTASLNLVLDHALGTLGGVRATATVPNRLPGGHRAAATPIAPSRSAARTACSASSGFSPGELNSASRIASGSTTARCPAWLGDPDAVRATVRPRGDHRGFRRCCAVSDEE
ncbi:hypothetical protein NMG29_32845 [Streptomyces cocklensis]|uniref:Uncharacterized protein n=1 Tax=Actinacidiphila cocklensis TaxID=887465 RepID=A0A9W4GSL6_9ACTN|nr:hypothetical protein [Actinacidiphila cocklensis]CAG6394880.1 hypothetical protein SCOCK_30113 [Actinacidiphila cocklensis]